MSDIETVEVEAVDGESDHMVRCNSCGYQKRKSTPGGCPLGHAAGWSYVGPIEMIGGFEVVDADTPDDIGGDPEPDEEEGEAEEAEPGPPPRPTGLEWAMGQVIDLNDQILRQQGVVDEKADDLKSERKRLETLQRDLNELISEAKKVRAAAEPDPERYPLLDGPRPEAIAPPEADTFEEFSRRKAVQARIDALGLPAKLVAVLADAGVETVNDWRRKREAIEEAGSVVTSIKGLTRARLETLFEALGALSDEWAREWDEAHPGAVPAESEEAD